MSRARSLSDLATQFSQAGLYVPSGETSPRILRCGVDPIDVATGVGGFPEGRFYVIHGDQSTGKTTFAGHWSANVIDLGGYVVYMDNERKLSQSYFEQIGVDFSTKRFIVARPRYIEEGFAMIQRTAELVRKKWEDDKPILVIWDSIHSLPAKRAYEKEFEEADYPPEAGAYDRGFRKATGIISDHRVTCLFVSQQRVEGGPVRPGMPPKAKIGIGRFVKHAASIVLDFKAPEAIKEGTTRVGSLCRVVVAKNQCALPWVQCKFPMMSATGLDVPAATFLAGKMVGLVDRNSRLEVQTPSALIKLHGLPNFRKLFENEPGIFRELRDAVIAKSSSASLPRMAEGESEEEGPSETESPSEE